MKNCQVNNLFRHRKILDKGFILTVAGLLVFSSPAFAAKKKKNKADSGMVKSTYEKTEKAEEPAPVEEPVAEVAAVDSVKLPAQKRTYFYKVDSEVLALVENGSPESLKGAMAKLRKNESEYDETEKVLIAISTQIMKNVWPSENVTWETFELTGDNPYLGALKTAENGIFDTSTGNTDFLSTILPAVVLLKPAATTAVYEDCEKAITSALALRPDSVFANYLYGILSEKQQKYLQAETFLRQAYANAGSSREVALAYVRVLRQNGNLALAAKVMNDISGVDPNSIEILKQNAYVAFASKDFASAEQFVGRVLQQTPNDLEFVLFRAKILIEKNDYIHAVSLLDVYARQDDSSLDYLLLRAKVQLDWSKNTTAATETVERTLQLYPENPEALMFAARISSQTDGPVAGQYADDLAAKVLEKNPENIDALTYALEGLTQRENWLEAYAISSRLINAADISPEVVTKHVSICIKLGKRTEAYEFAKKMQELNPTDDVIMQAYILAYSKSGNRDAVLKYIDSLMPTASSKMKSYLYYTRSSLQLTEENALADLRSSLISNPRNSDALFRMYEIYYQKEDYRKAQYYLRQVVAINPNDSSVKKLNEALTKLIN